MVCYPYLRSTTAGMPFEKNLRYIMGNDSCCEFYYSVIDVLLVFHFMLAASTYFTYVSQIPTLAVVTVR